MLEGKCETVKPFLLEKCWASLLPTTGAQSELEDRHNVEFCVLPSKRKKKKNGFKKKNKKLLHLKFSSSFNHKDNLLTLTTAPGYYYPQLREKEAVVY